MELSLQQLARFVDLPSQDGDELRSIFDDLGLEVKAVKSDAGDTLFDIETLAHRGDHLHHLGVARELSARLLSPMRSPQLVRELTEQKPSVPVRVETAKCLRYAILEMNIPQDLHFEVKGDRDSGDLPAIVRLLNSVQVELGAPMHAFDRSKVEGEIIVREADREEEVEALDGQSYRIPVGSILICDRKKTLAVAGVIGLANSCVSESTERVFIEAALFDPVQIRKTARKMGLSTEASYAFERGVDVEAPVIGLRRVAYLVGASVGGGTNAHLLGFREEKGQLPEKRKFSIALTDVRRELNSPRFPELEVISRLKYLGYGVEVLDQKKGILEVSVPSWRTWNVLGVSAVLEDIVRIVGLNRIKSTLPGYEVAYPEENRDQATLDRVEPALLGQGFLEVITKSYYSRDVVNLLEQLSPGITEKHEAIQNALDRSYSHMKVSNAVPFVELLGRNYRQGVQSAKIYEVGRVFGSFYGESSPYDYEREVLSIAHIGRWESKEWGAQLPSRTKMLFSLKGVVSNIVRAIGHEPLFGPGEHPFLHPGCQACVLIQGKPCGTIGLVHPHITKGRDCPVEVAFGELFFDQLSAHLNQVGFHPVSDQPAIRRDITLGLAERAFSGEISEALLKKKFDHLRSVDVIDEFVREEENQRRTTYRLLFQADDRTLESGEIDDQMVEILEYLAKKCHVRPAE